MGVAPEGAMTPEGAEELLQQVADIGDESFRRMAQRYHLKKCPHCNAVIEKNGGCDAMTCQCGCCFDWNEADTVVPCRYIHLNKKGFRFWCTTCRGCSKIATAKLYGVRTGIVVAAPAAVAVAIVLVVAAAIVLVVAVVLISVAFAIVTAVECVFD